MAIPISYIGTGKNCLPIQGLAYNILHHTLVRVVRIERHEETTNGLPLLRSTYCELIQCNFS